METEQTRGAEMWRTHCSAYFNNELENKAGGGWVPGGWDRARARIVGLARTGRRGHLGPARRTPPHLGSRRPPPARRRDGAPRREPQPRRR